MGSHGPRLCQLVLCGGTPLENTAQILEYKDRKYIFCSSPCLWIFRTEPDRYANHKDVVKRILSGEAPANLLELLRKYFHLTKEMWGKDMASGNYPWMKRSNPVMAPAAVGGQGRPPHQK
jgi:toluene monooxygenase system protein A